MDTSKRILLKVRVHPRSRKQEITKLSTDEYKIQVTSVPSKGEANRDVCKVIAAHFGVPISRVSIVGGHKSRNKVIIIEKD